MKDQNKPAMACGIAKHEWSIYDLWDAVLAVAAIEPRDRTDGVRSGSSAMVSGN